MKSKAKTKAKTKARSKALKYTGSKTEVELRAALIVNSKGE